MLSKLSDHQFVEPDWSLPKNVRALFTTRSGGVSAAPYDSLNLGDHVEDNPERVKENRNKLYKHIGREVKWLQQVHGALVADLALNSLSIERADAVYTCDAKNVCAVLTADCLPVLLCAQSGAEIAAVHCGWRSLQSGILLRTLERFSSGLSSISAFLGPAISQASFEVGSEVLDAFIEAQRQGRFGGVGSTGVEEAFLPSPVGENKYFADLYALARAELVGVGLSSDNISGGDFCTYSDEERFYSYRRDGVTGRMASLIWREE